MANRPTNQLDAMTPGQAVAVYAQSEKVKAGLIWVSQVADQVTAMDYPGRNHGIALLQHLARMVADESGLAARISGDAHWHEIGRIIEKALVMISSGVPQETGYHLARALSRVTRLGGQAAAVLEEHGLFRRGGGK